MTIALNISPISAAWHNVILDVIGIFSWAISLEIALQIA
jgi:hypothetical protein